MFRWGNSRESEGGSSLVTLALVTVATGVVAGIGGMGLALLLHGIQHVAFGYDMYQLHGAKSFLQGVCAASPVRRVLVLGACGLVAGVGWWFVRNFCKPLVSIKNAVKSEKHEMPVFATTCHALLQIITVALGSPLGREVAPREIAAVYARKIAQFAKLTNQESKVVVASAAGAGLAAVYNVPIGGALFTLEVLLGTFECSALLPAMVASSIASSIAWIGLGNATQYVFVRQTISFPVMAWAIAFGPLFGCAAFVFSKSVAHARKFAPRDWRLMPFCLLQFLALGAMSIPFPQLLGNGKGPIQLSLFDSLTPELALTFLFLKFLFITASLRGGAEGGLLTPGMTLGAMLATATVSVWNLVLPAIDPADTAIIGAGAFLASSMNMPLTAIALAFEFTHFPHDFFYPLMFAVAGSYATFVFLKRRTETCPAARPGR